MGLQRVWCNWDAEDIRKHFWAEAVFITLTVGWFHRCIHILKLGKLYTLKCVQFIVCQLCKHKTNKCHLGKWWPNALPNSTLSPCVPSNLNCFLYQTTEQRHSFQALTKKQRSCILWLKVTLDPCPTDWLAKEIKPEIIRNSRGKSRKKSPGWSNFDKMFIICVAE